MSKTAKIRTLLAEGKLTVSEIAQETGVLDAYVRVVKQRGNPDSWCNKALKTGDHELARQEGRRAYRIARQEGKTQGQANNAWVHARFKSLAETRVK
jgi:hypothetical protein